MTATEKGACIITMALSSVNTATTALTTAQGSAIYSLPTTADATLTTNKIRMTSYAIN